MNATWITLAVALIVGMVKLISYLLGDKRRLRILKVKECELEERLRSAVARLDTVNISDIERRLNGVRAQIADINRK